MDFENLDKKTAIAVLDEVINAINANRPDPGENRPIIWFNAYTDVREYCHQLKDGFYGI